MAKKRVSVTDAADVYKVGREAQESLESPINLLVLVDAHAPRELVCAVRDALVPERPEASVVVIPINAYATHTESFDVAVMLCGDDTASAQAAMTYLGKRQIPVAFIAETSLAFPEVDPTHEIYVERICSAEPRRATERLARWLVLATNKHLAMAANFVFCRQDEVHRLTNDCAVQCAAVGALGLVGGADLPVMCVNQSKLALQMAAIYGHELSLARAGEIAGVVGSALLWRGLSRKLLGVIPGADWAVKAAVGYVGTRATSAVLNIVLDPNRSENKIVARVGGALDSARSLLTKNPKASDMQIAVASRGGELA